jgi:hypothetical protein
MVIKRGIQGYEMKARLVLAGFPHEVFSTECPQDLQSWAQAL